MTFFARISAVGAHRDSARIVRRPATVHKKKAEPKARGRPAPELFEYIRGALLSLSPEETAVKRQPGGQVRSDFERTDRDAAGAATAMKVLGCG